MPLPRPNKLAALALALTGAAALAAPALASTRTVVVKDFAFSPRTLTVARGTVVRWVFRDRAPHNVAARGPQRFSSGAPRMTGAYAHRMTRRGVYRIVCTIHPGMQMTLRVR